MWIRDEIAATVTRVGADAKALSPDEVKAAEAQLERLFARPGTGPLWQTERSEVRAWFPEGSGDSKRSICLRVA